MKRLMNVALVIGAGLLTLSFNAQSRMAKVDKNSFICLNTGKLPIVYHEKYNISLGSFFDSVMSHLHPFDGRKYGKVHSFLCDTLSLNKDQFYAPETMVSDDDLKIVHSQEYLNSLHSSRVLSRAFDLKDALFFIPNHLLQRTVLDAIRYATNGTVLAADLALQYGWSINIGGGFHHAKYDNGAGGCILGDIQLAIEKLWLKNPNLNVLIVDLDAHQGNGYSSYFKDSFGASNQKVFIFDMYNKNEYPFNKYWDMPEDAQLYVDFGIALDGGNLACKIGSINCEPIDYLHLTEGTENRRVSAREYLALLKDNLPKAINELIAKGKKPDLIIYNAGTDPFAKDTWGGMNVSYDGIIERDRFVWLQAKENNIPIMMLTSGGYSAESPLMIAETITNVLIEKEIIARNV